jgi:hypothetical protein
MLKKPNDNGGLKTIGFDDEVLLSQGFNNQTLGLSSFSSFFSSMTCTKMARIKEK